MTQPEVGVGVLAGQMRDTEITHLQPVSVTLAKCEVSTRGGGHRVDGDDHEGEDRERGEEGHQESGAWSVLQRDGEHVLFRCLNR